MKHGADWYKREPTAYLGGVQGMTAKEHAVFSVILDLIYQHGGSVNNDPAWFAGWISDMGSAAVRATIATLIDRGKLSLEDGQLSNNRAKNQAKTKENLSENRAKIGKKGGISSGISRAASSENKDLGEAIASSREEKIREDKKEGGGEGACEISTFREQILSACNVDPVSGLTGQGGRQLGKPDDMAEANRWLELPGLTPETICTEVRRLIKAKRDGPPSSFKYFTEAMQRLSGALTQPALTPIAGTRNAKPSREQFDTAHREYARRVSAGAIDRGPDPSNPFAA